MSDIARKLLINGTVQGVGFRPFVFGIAKQLSLNGTVLNNGLGVEIILEGPPQSIELFKNKLRTELPPLAKIESIEQEELNFSGLSDFRIIASQQTKVNTMIPADAAVCKQCLKELTDKGNRRYRYPFINCTHCGPRYTITSHLPYDRPQTSMKDFPMCPECLKEYTDPLDRRFHAQPNACDTCGPHIWLTDNKGKLLPTKDPIRELTSAIKQGKIVAVKGIGGFHLVCDAKNDQAVTLLRQRKTRPSKPFALMFMNRISAEKFVDIDDSSQNILDSSCAPIVLCPKKSKADEELPMIAPRLNRLGIMYPYTPIHWLIFFEYCSRPDESNWFEKYCELALVMTSANAGGEPLEIENDHAITALGDICDLFLMHNRDILIRCDDSVVLNQCGNLRVIRRARGYTPQAIKLGFTGPSVIATGAWLKNTACVTKGNHAYLTQHIGDLDRVSNCQTLSQSISHLQEIFEVYPEVIACDMHPDFYSSRLAEELAEKYNVQLVPVQHHHSHIAAVMAEHRLCEPVIGLALDGVGFGIDATSWGGELLKVSPEGFSRLSSLKPLKIPGGDKCAREGWRIAYALLQDHGLSNSAQKLYGHNSQAKGIEALLNSDFPVPLSSSLGRSFDAAASLLGLCHTSSYEGEAPTIFESVANREGNILFDQLPQIDSKARLDIDKLLVSLIHRKDLVQAAADFHKTIGYSLGKWAIEACHKNNIQKLCVSGGCCLNTLLMRAIKETVEETGIELFQAQNIPTNDGGISLGQAWVVLMSRFNREKLCA